MLTAELGAGPLALARAHRAHTARLLIETTPLGWPTSHSRPVSPASGSSTTRSARSTGCRRARCAPRPPPGARAGGGPPARAGNATPGTVHLRLAYRPPLHADALLDFLARRAVPGTSRSRDGTYRRGLRLPHGPAEVALTPLPGYVAAALRLADVRDLAPAVARCRRLLDLDADPEAVDALLGADPALAELVAREPVIRLPRAVDGFELAVRAVVGQQVSVATARATLGGWSPRSATRCRPRCATVRPRTTSPTCSSPPQR